MRKYFLAALREARAGARRGEGGPFGAVIVYKGKIVGRGRNSVPSSNDPTAHAEILAIRQACKKLKTFNLSQCILYSTCEPCPMCRAAVYWARLKKVYFAATRADAAKIGFDDQFFYDILCGRKRSKVPIIQDRGAHRQTRAVMREWAGNPKRAVY